MAAVNICSVNECGKRSICRGWCSAHYNRWRSYGDPLGTKPNPRRVRSVTELICAVDDCGQPVKCGGYCATHYHRYRKYGDPLGGRAIRSPKGSPCAVEGCTRPLLSRGYCKPHYRRFMKYGDPLISSTGGGRRVGHLPLPENIDVDGTRVCNDCGDAKPLGEFAIDGRSRGGRKRICKQCTTQRSLAWQRTNRERSRNSARLALIRRLYGEDGLEVEARRAAGEGCDICGNQTARMAIDHCHTTGRVRGLLCKDCNLVLGWMNDDPKRLHALADYLERRA